MLVFKILKMYVETYERMQSVKKVPVLVQRFSLMLVKR